MQRISAASRRASRSLNANRSQSRPAPGLPMFRLCRNSQAAARTLRVRGADQHRVSRCFGYAETRRPLRERFAFVEQTATRSPDVSAMPKLAGCCANASRSWSRLKLQCEYTAFEHFAAS